MISLIGGYPLIELFHFSNDSKMSNDGFMIKMYFLGNLPSGFCSISFNNTPQNAILDYRRSSTTRLNFKAKISSSELYKPKSHCSFIVASLSHILLIFRDVSFY